MQRLRISGSVEVVSTARNNMNKKELQSHKDHPKRLEGKPTFKVLKKGKLPKPFKSMGSNRIFSTELLDVSTTHTVVFMWRNGEQVTDSAFYAWLFCRLQNNDLYPIFELHYHPSHKGVHCKLPCKTDLDYTNRQLPQAPELDLVVQSGLDPRIEIDREKLILKFCESCGISVGQTNELWK